MDWDRLIPPTSPQARSLTFEDAVRLLALVDHYQHALEHLASAVQARADHGELLVLARIVDGCLAQHLEFMETYWPGSKARAAAIEAGVGGPASCEVLLCRGRATGENVADLVEGANSLKSFAQRLMLSTVSNADSLRTGLRNLGTLDEQCEFLAQLVEEVDGGKKLQEFLDSLPDTENPPKVVVPAELEGMATESPAEAAAATAEPDFLWQRLDGRQWLVRLGGEEFPIEQGARSRALEWIGEILAKGPGGRWEPTGKGTPKGRADNVDGRLETFYGKAPAMLAAYLRKYITRKELGFEFHGPDRWEVPGQESRE